MSEEEKKELKYIERFIRSMGLLKEANLISNLQKELDKKDKVIDLMAEKLVEDSDVFSYQHEMTEEKWKEYFYKKAEGKDE